MNQFNTKLFGSLLQNNITLAQLNIEDEKNIQSNISNITKINELELIFTGYIDKTPFMIYKNKENLFICTNTLTLYYDIDRENENFDVNIIKHIGNNKIKQYTSNYLKITIKKDKITLNQEESMIEDQLPTGYKYHTKKSYNATNGTESMSFTCEIYWKEKPTTEKPPLIMGNITINNEHKKFAFLLRNGIYIPGETNIQTFEELQQLLKETGNMSLQHSEEFINIISNEIIKPEFIKAIETLIKNNIKIQENTLTVSGHQFKLQFPHQNNID